MSKIAAEKPECDYYQEFAVAFEQIPNPSPFILASIYQLYRAKIGKIPGADWTKAAFDKKSMELYDYLRDHEKPMTDYLSSLHAITNYCNAAILLCHPSISNDFIQILYTNVWPLTPRAEPPQQNLNAATIDDLDEKNQSTTAAAFTSNDDVSPLRQQRKRKQNTGPDALLRYQAKKATLDVPPKSTVSAETVVVQNKKAPVTYNNDDDDNDVVDDSDSGTDDGSSLEAWRAIDIMLAEKLNKLPLSSSAINGQQQQFVAIDRQPREDSLQSSERASTASKAVENAVLLDSGAKPTTAQVVVDPHMQTEGETLAGEKRCISRLVEFLVHRNSTAGEQNRRQHRSRHWKSNH